jgi:hypothetical protein
VKAEEIMQVLRMTAMGRLNTPMQEEFCNKLATVMGQWAALEKSESLGREIDDKLANYETAPVESPGLLPLAEQAVQAIAKRTRKPKAE